MQNILRLINSIALTFFGGLSVFLTLSIIFDWFGIREKEGNYVLFIVYANLICGIIYLIAAYTNFLKFRKTFLLLSGAIGILLAAFIAFLFYINSGGIHEEKTIGAMLFRIGITIGFTLLSFYTINKNNKQ